MRARGRRKGAANAHAQFLPSSLPPLLLLLPPSSPFPPFPSPISLFVWVVFCPRHIFIGGGGAASILKIPSFPPAFCMFFQFLAAKRVAGYLLFARPLLARLFGALFDPIWPRALLPFCAPPSTIPAFFLWFGAEGGEAALTPKDKEHRRKHTKTNPRKKAIYNIFGRFALIVLVVCGGGGG